MEIDDSQLRIAIETFTLEMFERGCDRTNYEVLRSLPSDVKTLALQLGITKVPLTRRLNQLVAVGLVDWKKGTGVVDKTRLTGLFLELLGKLRYAVQNEAIVQAGIHLPVEKG